MTSKSALLYGFLGSNVGDVAVTRGAIVMARSLGIEGPLTVVAPKLNRRARETWETDVWRHYPYAELVEWDFKSIQQDGEVSEAALERIGCLQLLKNLKIDDADTLVYAGGEHLFSYGKPGDDWNLLLRLAPFFAAATAGKQVRLLPSTFGPFDTDFSVATIQRFLALLPDIPVRDTLSINVISNLGFTARYCLDPAFFIRDVVPSSPSSARSANILMRLNQYGLRVGNQESFDHAAFLAEHGYEKSLSYRLHRDTAKALAARGFSLRFFIQTLADEAPTRALYQELLAELGPSVVLLKPTTIQSFITELGNGSVTLTSRFHGSIFSLLADRPATTIYFKDHGHKIPGLFEGLGMSDLCFDGDHSQPQLIADAAASSAQRASWSEKLETLRAMTLQSLMPYFPKTDSPLIKEGVSLCQVCGVGLTAQEV